jgi:hypothetical protein
MPKLLEQARNKMRTRHYSYRTEQTYLHWIREFILFHHKQHPSVLGAPDVSSFLTHLAIARKVSAFYTKSSAGSSSFPLSPRAGDGFAENRER